MNYLIASHHSWNKKNFEEIKKRNDLGNFYFISRKEELTKEFLSKIKPRYIFFPHWSHIVPKDIIKSYECVCFHMTDLPYGRGGSPLQNLIIRGIKNTKISALQMSDILDGGPIYTKRNLSLSGKAESIYKRASKIIFNIIIELIEENPIPKAQEGEVTNFNRRTDADSTIDNVKSLEKLFDFIRMLDAQDYPNAYIENDNFRFFFTNVKFSSDNELIAKVQIKRKE